MSFVCYDLQYASFHHNLPYFIYPYSYMSFYSFNYATSQEPDKLLINFKTNFSVLEIPLLVFHFL